MPSWPTGNGVGWGSAATRGAGDEPAPTMAASATIEALKPILIAEVKQTGPTASDAQARLLQATVLARNWER
ncbi:hypothetical protein MHEI_08130 [Mycobacterium heidelbergense]|nr:hypothetical protein MHEI_08130 [Mycobacterium heidelbergense]